MAGGGNEGRLWGGRGTGPVVPLGAGYGDAPAC